MNHDCILIYKLLKITIRLTSIRKNNWEEIEWYMDANNYPISDHMQLEYHNYQAR